MPSGRLARLPGHEAERGERARRGRRPAAPALIEQREAAPTGQGQRRRQGPAREAASNGPRKARSRSAAQVRAIFWDVGGVVLSNGWDRAARRKAATRFHLDWEEFQDRHELVVDAFETGRATLDEYLHRTVFYRARRFRREEFRAFMLAQSEPHTGTLALLRRLARTRRYFMATLNNESLDLNLYRIERFRLREYFSAFFSSCFLGVKKPDEAIYHLALRITQRAPEECLFVDDRPLNLESARGCGMRTIHYQGPGQLEEELRRNGVEAGTSRLRPGKGTKRRPPPKPVR